MTLLDKIKDKEGMPKDIEDGGGGFGCKYEDVIEREAHNCCNSMWLSFLSSLEISEDKVATAIKEEDNRFISHSERTFRKYAKAICTSNIITKIEGGDNGK